MNALMHLSIIASVGSILVGALVRQFGKMISGVSAFLFAAVFASLMIQMNLLGLLSAILLVVAGVMVFVSPATSFKSSKAQPSSGGGV